MKAYGSRGREPPPPNRAPRPTASPQTCSSPRGFSEAIAAALPAWRRVVATAVSAGVPVPVFSAALSYYDGLRRDRLPAALTQGLRDSFGAHTYRRADREGTFHTLWGEDKSEIEAVDTH